MCFRRLPLSIYFSSSSHMSSGAPPPPPKNSAGDDSGDSHRRKAAWEKPSSSAVDGGAPAAAADNCSWPVLSKSTKPSSSNSHSDFHTNASSSVLSNPSLEPLISQPPIITTTAVENGPGARTAPFRPRPASQIGRATFRPPPRHVPRPFSAPPPPFPAMPFPYTNPGNRLPVIPDPRPTYNNNNNLVNAFSGMVPYQQTYQQPPAIPGSYGRIPSNGYPSSNGNGFYGQDYATSHLGQAFSFQPYRPITPRGYTGQPAPAPFYTGPQFDNNMSQQMYEARPNPGRPETRVVPLIAESSQESPRESPRKVEVGESSKPRRMYSICFPPNSPLPKHVMEENVIRQINFYFSDENMAVDSYLRGQMDGRGWIRASTIVKFHRIAYMMVSVKFIVNSMKKSTMVEVKKNKFRSRDSWWMWTEKGLPSSDNEEEEEDDDDDDNDDTVVGTNGGTGINEGSNGKLD